MSPGLTSRCLWCVRACFDCPRGSVKRPLEFSALHAQRMAGVQFKQLAHAVSPAIYGNELLKAGLLLALLGGVRKVWWAVAISVCDQAPSVQPAP